jgi:glutathione S-transferase
MWMFGFYVNAEAASGLGMLYIVGRTIYFFSYIRDPKKRSLGYGLSAGPVTVLLIGAVIGTAMALVRGH